MRRVTAVLIAVFAILGMLAPPSFAQAPAAPPAPKVTINGLVDFVVTAYDNWPGGIDVTDTKDRGFYSRERGVFTLTGEIGKSKGVWAIELDFTNGTGNIANGGTGISGTSATADLDSDVPGFTETKWLYVETPLSGPGSIMPFIPVPSILRGGIQPARGHDYKPGIHFSGDFPGATIESTWAPNLRSTLTFAQIGEAVDQSAVAFSNQSDSYAILASVEFDVFKGLTVKPTYSYASFDGGNCGTSNLGVEAKNGFNPSANCGAVKAGGTLRTSRHTFGGDVRWTAGPFSFQPTVLYQMGTQELPQNVFGKHDTDIRSWIIDAVAGFRTGPLNLEVRGMWTPGMAAQHIVTNGGTIRYYQPINSGFSYMSGWSDIQTGGIDYITSLFVPAGGVTLRQSPSYDKYGRRFFAFAADYALTPALTLKSVVNVSWTDEDVDTSGVMAATGITSPRIRGTRDEESYLGTDLNAGLTYRFAPNVSLDLVGAYMWTGEAMNHARTGSCTSAAACKIFEAGDVWKLTSRVRVTF